MKNHQTFIVFLGIMFISGCAAVPKQVVDAMEIQQEEIERVKTLYFVNLNNQLDAIQKYQLAILDIYEEQHLAKNCKSLGEVTEDGVTIISEIPPRGDKALDHINIQLMEDIQGFYKVEREKVITDISFRREQINLANRNFENISEINSLMNDYMQSLVRLKNSQDKMAMAIKTKLEKIIPIPFSLDVIPDPKTIEDLATILTSKNNGTNK